MKTKRKKDDFYRHNYDDALDTQSYLTPHEINYDKDHSKRTGFAKEFGVSDHAIYRYAERVLGLGHKDDLDLCYRDKSIIANTIEKDIHVDFRNTDLSMTISTDDYVVVVTNGIVVTVKTKEMNR